MNTKDPLLIQSEPVTLLLPVLENNLKKLNIKVTRDVLVKRFYNGAERTAVISGSQDHPAHLYDEALIRNLMKEIWEQGGLPFSFQVPALCDGIAQGHYGMQFSLFSRDLTTQIVVSQVLAHHYDSAIFISGCDKNPIGFTGAAVVIDQIYRKYYKKNFYSIFLNTPVMKDIPLPLSVKKLLPDDNKLKPLLGETLKCNVYAKYYKVLAEMVKEKKLAETKKRALLNRISQYTCITGGTCAFMGTGSTSKFILYALGLVPDEYFLPFPGTFSMPVHAKKAVKILNRITGKIGFSPVNLITKNFQNALKVLGSVNGSLNLFLHLKYLAGLLGDPSLFKSSSVHGVPLLYNGNMSLFDMSKKRIHFSIMRSLFDRNILKDNPSITGSWVQRLKKYSGSSVTSDGRSNFIQFAGNIFKSVLIKLNMKEYQKLEKLNNKIFIAKIYHSQDKLINDIMKGKIKYGSLRKKNEADKINDVNRTSNLIAIFLLDQGIEPRGMPEMYYPTEYINNDSYLKDRALLITDGRFSGATYGFSFGYMEQLYHDEQLKDGALILFDFKNKKINLLNDKQYFKKNKIVSVKKPEKKRKTNRVDSPYRYLLDKIRQK